MITMVLTTRVPTQHNQASLEPVKATRGVLFLNSSEKKNSNRWSKLRVPASGSKE